MALKNVQDIYPATPLQAGMILHSLLAGGSGAYVEQWSCTFRGRLGMGGVRRAWQLAIDRHAILRTAFVTQGLAEPVQAVRAQVSLPFEESDWRSLPEEGEAAWEAHLDADRRRDFPLNKAPLMRLFAARAGDDR